MASPKVDEKTPLVTRPADLVEDDELTGSLRDRVTVSYTTIALVSALLAGVSFLAYATPPAVIFSAAGGSAASTALAPQPAPQHKHKHEPTTEQIAHFLVEARNLTYNALFDIYGIGACCSQRFPSAPHCFPTPRGRAGRRAVRGGGRWLASASSNPHLPNFCSACAPPRPLPLPVGLPASLGRPNLGSGPGRGHPAAGAANTPVPVAPDSGPSAAVPHTQ